MSYYPSSSTDMATRTTVRELVATYVAAERDVRSAFATIVATQARLNAVFALGGRADSEIRIDATRHGWNDCFDQPDQAIERVARQAWRCIVERLELRRIMSIAAYAKLEGQIEKGELPPITEESVMAFAQQQAQAIPSMFVEAVKEVFEWLRPRNSKLKTNSELEIGPRVILPYVVEEAWGDRAGYRVDYNRVQSLIALERVFQSLDGRGQIAKTHFSELQRVIEASGAAGRGETEYFEFRAYANRNLHLRFRRLDLLTKLNQIAGGKRLRPHQEGASL